MNSLYISDTSFTIRLAIGRGRPYFIQNKSITTLEYFKSLILVKFRLAVTFELRVFNSQGRYSPTSQNSKWKHVNGLD